MTHYNTHRERMLLVARALGPKLVSQTAFVGGCATGLLITDSMTKESVRYTDDVDLIVHVMATAAGIDLVCSSASVAFASHWVRTSIAALGWAGCR